MTRRLHLPEDFTNRPFRVRDGLDAGLAASRLDGSDLEAPFHGIRTPASFEVVDARSAALAYAPRLTPSQAFGSVSAAALWGLPLPPHLERDTRVHLVSPQSKTRSTAKGIVARRVADARWNTVMLDDRRTADPVLTLTTLVCELSLIELVAVVDALRSTAENYVGLWSGDRPMAGHAALLAAQANVGAIAGVSRLREAIAFSRENVESPKESALRWVLMRKGGFPEPELNVRVYAENGEYLGKPDAMYREAKLAIEYEGDQHRTDRAQWRIDVRRAERFIANGWRYMRVTDDDIGVHAAGFIARVGDHLAPWLAAA